MVNNRPRWTLDHPSFKRTHLNEVKSSYFRFKMLAWAAPASMRTRLALGLTLALAILCVWTGPGRAETFADSIISGGRERTFLVVAPESVKSRKKLPTVIALHGPLMKGASMKRILGMDGIAERNKFVVVYPDGIRRRWNDGRRGDASGPDDVRFIRKLADHMVRSGLSDPDRLYLLGVSTGGMLTYRIACEAPDIFAAYAAIIASMSVNVADGCRSRGSAPIIIINANDDPVVPWEGGSLGRFRRRGEVLSTPETVDFWRRHNGCSEKTETKPLPDKDGRDGSTVFAEQYIDCQSDAAVVLLTVEGGGHLPPGARLGDRPILQSMLGGPANRDISAADVSWKFFKRFPF